MSIHIEFNKTCHYKNFSDKTHETRMGTGFRFKKSAKNGSNCRTREVLVYSNGSVNVLHSGREDFTVICNLNTNYGEATPTTCAMWTAMLQSIKKKNGNANFYFNGEGSCATMGTYGSAPVPVYIGDA